MPLDKAKISELREAIAIARKRELAFGLCLGKKPEGTVLITHKSKAPPALGKIAKAEGETTHFTFGRLSVKSSELTLVIEGKMPPGIAKRVKEFMKAASLSMKVIVLEPEGDISSGDAEEDSTENTARTETPKPNAQEERPVSSDKPGKSTTTATAETGNTKTGNADTGKEAQAQDGEASDATGARQSGQSDPPQEKQDIMSAPADEPVKLSPEPSKRDLSGEFNDVRKDIMKTMRQLEGPAQAELLDQIKQFGELMKSKDFADAQKLMDDLATAQGSVTEPQRGRARDEITQIDNLVGDIEAEMDVLEAALIEQGAAAA